LTGSETFTMLAFQKKTMMMSWAMAGGKKTKHRALCIHVANVTLSVYSELLWEVAYACELVSH